VTLLLVVQRKLIPFGKRRAGDSLLPTLTIRIYDVNTGRGIPNKHVYLFPDVGGIEPPENAQYVGVTDQNGIWRIDNIYGFYRVTVENSGWVAVEGADEPSEEWRSVYSAFGAVGVTRDITYSIGLQRVVVVPAKPDLKIERLDYPSSARPGESVTISWDFCNYGGNGEYPEWMWTRLLDLDTGAELHKDIGKMATGVCVIERQTFTMPDRDWRLRVEAGYGEVVTDSKEFTIALVAPPAVGWDVIVSVSVKVGEEVRPAGEGEVEVMLLDIGEGADYNVYHMSDWKETGSDGKVRFSHVEYDWIVGFEPDAWHAWSSNRFRIRARLKGYPSIYVDKIIFLSTTDWEVL